MPRISLDTSTLILLAKTDILEKVCKDFEVVITEEVFLEATRKKIADALLIERLCYEGTIKRVDTPPDTDSITANFSIARGEASALAYAHAETIPVGIDDGLGIKAAKVLGIAFVTAIHFLIALRRNGVIDQEIALLKLDSLDSLGRYSSSIINDARKRL